jgi:hypothetical protein
MRNLVVKAFDQYVVGTSNVYSPTDLSQVLGSADRLCGIVIAHAFTGTNPTVTIQFEHSFDGTRWMSQNATPELNAWGLPGFFNTNGFSSTRIPALNFVRMRVALGGTSPTATLEVWLCGRSPNR